MPTRWAASRHRTSKATCAASSAVIPETSRSGRTSTTSAPTMFTPRQERSRSNASDDVNPPMLGVPCRAQGRVNHVDVERDVGRRIGERARELLDPARPFAADIVAGQHGHAMISRKLQVRRRVQGALDSDRDHAPGIDDPVLDGAAERRSVAPLVAPHDVDRVKVAVKVKQGETALRFAEPLPRFADVRIGD